MFASLLPDASQNLKITLFITAKPQVLLVGQYSVGKTSFIRYLLGRDFPGQRVGPEPTTDRFTGGCFVTIFWLYFNDYCGSDMSSHAA